MTRRLRISAAFLAALAVGAAAIAGAITHSTAANFSGTTTNISVGANRLELTTVVNEVDDWYRHDWDGTTWEAQGNKDSGNGTFTDGDRCLRDNDNGAINGPKSTVNSHEFRTGTGTTNITGTNYVSTVPPATPVPLPTGMEYVDGVRFLISGARIAQRNLTVRFNYLGGGTAAVVVPILLDTTTGNARDRNGTNYTVNDFTLVRNQTVTWDADAAGGTDCLGTGGDDVTVNNPNPNTVVTDIEFEYSDFTAADAATGWLGGPLAVSLVTDEVEIESTFTYRGEYVSPSTTTGSVDAGEHAIWYRLSWGASIPTGSQILVHLTCGDDDNSNGVLAGTELAVEQTYALSTLSTPYTLPTQCHGRYLLYRVELIDEENDDPLLNDITFTWDPDGDVDGYGDDGTATVNDCNDNNAAINPGAAEITGDEVDQNCDNNELCFDDADNDNSRHASNTRLSVGNVTCGGSNEGRLSDPIDCNDNDPTRFVGATEVTGDGIDQNCDNHDNCFRDADRDGHGTTLVVTSVGATCATLNQEATVNTDCDDANSDRFPGNPEDVGDSVDQDCNDREICYQDVDNDNARHGTLTLITAVGDHNCTGANEGQNTDPVDCNDNDPTISPLLTEVVGNNKDDDCSGAASCYRDLDNDGTRTDVVFVTVDTDCNDANEGETADPLDCNDSDADVSPLDVEVAGNDKDDDCSGLATCFRDDDNDNARTGVTFVTVDTDCNDANEGRDIDPLDCDDNDAQRSPLLTETVGNEKDNDCNGQESCWLDDDNDNARNATLTIVSVDQDCQDTDEQVTGAAIDCDDTDAQAFPGNTETTGNGNDNNCDGIEVCFLDNDDDGYRHVTNTINSTTNENCTDAREGRSTDGIDCDDNRALTNPGAADVCGNGIDDNCNGVGDFGSTSFLDDDGDGLLFATETSIGTGDCDDDSDNDTLDDYDEHITLHTSPTNDDSDGDGRDDAEEVGGSVSNPLNTDLDAFIDALDTDDDNDTVSSLQEFTDPDGQDGDGVPNWFDDDSDGDGYSDTYEWANFVGTRDQDVDGRNDYVDRDSDNDTVLDRDELGSQAAPANSDGDALPNRIDRDDDGDCVATIDEVGNPTPGMHSNFDGVDNVDYLDNDDDNDGEMSCVEDPDQDGNPADDDTDGDGSPNHKDDDDDGDLVPTLVENAVSAGRDVDFDGLVNSIDFDSDEDGWLDEDETDLGLLVDFDGDNDADFVDLDSDDDLVPDDLEGSSASPIDTDGDLQIDRLDEDDDDDLIPTAEECSLTCGNNQPWDDDFDDDGFADYVDADDDNDNVRTRDEDLDGDGDPRNDNSDAGLTFPDGQPDYLDADDDGDGIDTRDEDPDGDYDPLSDDTDRDGKPDYVDEDDDGDALYTFDETELHDFGTGTDDPRDYDFDGDGIPNYRDADDDGDRVDTICEITYGISHLVVDSDGDTFLDGTEWYNFIYLDLVLDEGAPIPESDYRDDNGNLSGTDCFSPWDRDSDGLINPIDSDDDNDGLATGADEIGIDFDCLPGTEVPAGDGIPDYVDRDSDNDGVPDNISGNAGTEGLGDADGDTIPDFLDCDDSGDFGDSDVDGILNGAERDLCLALGVDVSPPCLQNPDIDQDGVIDGLESGVDLTRLLDTDGDTIPDLIDTDDEGDGQASAAENRMVGCFSTIEARYCFYSDQGIVPDNYTCAAPPSGPDQAYWRFRCDDEFGNRLWFDFGGNALGDYPNTDAPTGGALPRNPDATPDFRDDDDDGDGRPTLEEGMGDDDGDGIPNAYDPNDADGPDADADLDGLITRDETSLGTDPYDPDSDADSVLDGVEVGSVSTPFDHDGDSVLDALDPDDDNDTIPTLVEGVANLDGDEWPNFLDVDSDGDGKLDRDEGADADVDCDGLWNAYDADDADGPCVNGDGTGGAAEAYTSVGCGCTSGGASGAGLGLGVWMAGVFALRRRSVASRHRAVR